jgi:hypothetical protein
MHYQNINSFGLLSLAGKKASLVLPFNKAMDNFFFISGSLFEDKSCGIRGLAEIILQITSDMSRFIFSFLIDATMKLKPECFTRPGAGFELFSKYIDCTMFSCSPFSSSIHLYHFTLCLVVLN